jgi:hypothetical protein
MRLFACVVALAACGPKPAPVAPQDPATTQTTTRTEPHTPATTTTPPSTVTASGGGAHCLYVEPEHRVVRCYWERERCEEQLAFNKKLVASQKCESVAEAHCFSEPGQSEACYPSAAECDATVVKMKKRKRPVSQCTAKRGP